MKISVFGASYSGDRFSLTYDMGQLELQSDDYRFDGDIQLDYSVSNTEDNATVTGTISAPVVMSCSRCLEECRIDVVADLTLCIKRLNKGEEPPDDNVDDERDPDVLVYASHDENDIDISGYVHDAILLGLPLKPLCREDCRGLCQICGHNLNEGDCGCRVDETDERWRTLGALLNKSKNDNK